MSNSTGTEYDPANNGTGIVAAPNNTNSPTTNNPTTVSADDDDMGSDGLQAEQIGIIVGVLVAVLLITAVVLFIIFRRRKANKNTPTKATGTSEVYADTTAPLDDESKVMLKSGQNGKDQMEMEAKEPLPEAENTTESSPLKEHPSATVAVANESSITLVNDDGNA